VGAISDAHDACLFQVGGEIAAVAHNADAVDAVPTLLPLMRLPLLFFALLLQHLPV